MYCNGTSTYNLTVEDVQVYEYTKSDISYPKRYMSQGFRLCLKGLHILLRLFLNCVRVWTFLLQNFSTFEKTIWTNIIFLHTDIHFHTFCPQLSNSHCNWTNSSVQSTEYKEIFKKNEGGKNHKIYLICIFFIF